MFKKLALGLALALTLAGSGVVATATAPVAAAAETHTASAVQLPSAPAAAAQAAPLNALEMAEVQGDGLWKKFKKWVKKVVKKVIGVIIQEIVKAITDWIEEIFSSVTGGEQQEGSDVQVREYASQADYDVDNAYADYTQTNDWQQTNVWYGDSGGCGTQERDGHYYYQQEITAC